MDKINPSKRKLQKQTLPKRQGGVTAARSNVQVTTVPTMVTPKRQKLVKRIPEKRNMKSKKQVTIVPKKRRIISEAASQPNNTKQSSSKSKTQLTNVTKKPGLITKTTSVKKPNRGVTNVPNRLTTKKRKSVNKTPIKRPSEPVPRIVSKRKNNPNPNLSSSDNAIKRQRVTSPTTARSQTAVQTRVSNASTTEPTSNDDRYHIATFNALPINATSNSVESKQFDTGRNNEIVPVTPIRDTFGPIKNEPRAIVEEAQLENNSTSNFLGNMLGALLMASVGMGMESLQDDVQDQESTEELSANSSTTADTTVTSDIPAINAENVSEEPKIDLDC